MAGNTHEQSERFLAAAEGYLTLGMPDHALKELARVSAADNRGLPVHALRGEALRQKEQYEEALRAFQHAAEQDATDLTALMGLAWCYKRTDRLSKAIEAAEQAYRASPEEPVLLYNLACYYSLAGDKEQALSWLGRALRMQPSLCRLIAEETDFDGLRDDPDFRFVLGE